MACSIIQKKFYNYYYKNTRVNSRFLKRVYKRGDSNVLWC